MNERVEIPSAVLLQLLEEYIARERATLLEPWTTLLREPPSGSYQGNVAPTEHWTATYERRLESATAMGTAAADGLASVVASLNEYAGDSLALVMLARAKGACFLWVTPELDRVITHFVATDRRAS